MSRTLVLIGTRKGCFVLESDADRRDWSLRGPFCERCPCTTPSTTRDRARSSPPRRASGTAWPSGAAAISARPGSTPRRASATRTAGRSSKVSTLAAGHDRLLVGVEAPGIFESRDGGANLFDALDPRRRARQRGLGRPRQPAARASRHLRHRARIRTIPSRFYAIVQGVGPLETTDGGSNWAPRNRGLRADRPLRPRGGRLLRAQARPRADDPSGCSSRTTSACTAPTTAAHSWTEITEGLPTEFGFGAAVNPHDRDTFLVIPLDPGHGRTMPDGEAAVWITHDAGSSWQRLRQGPSAERTPTSASSARGWRSTR